MDKKDLLMPDVAITLCKLHLEMAAYVVVLENPFFTVAGIGSKTKKASAGVQGETQKVSYTIRNVPPGKYVLQTWHKKLKLKGGGQKVTVEKGKTTSADLTITKAKYAKKK